MRRRRWQRILGHPLTVGLLTAGSALVFVAAPLVMAEGLTRLFVRCNWFYPEQPAGAALLWWKRQEYEQDHLDACRKVANTLTGVLSVSSMLLLVRRAARYADPWFYRVTTLPIIFLAPVAEQEIVQPLAHRRGPKTAALACFLAATFYVAPVMHTLMSEAVRNIVARGEDKVLDVDES
jgi:hypothetical protein